MCIVELDYICAGFIINEIKAQENYKIRFIKQKTKFKKSIDITPAFIFRQTFDSDWNYVSKYRFKVNDFFSEGFKLRANLVDFSQSNSALNYRFKKLKKLIVLNFLKYQARKLVGEYKDIILGFCYNGLVFKESFRILKPLNKFSKYDEAVGNLHFQIGSNFYTKHKSHLDFYFDFTDKRHRKNFKLFQKLIYAEIRIILDEVWLYLLKSVKYTKYQYKG